MTTRPAFTLIETVISLSIMSVLFLGLSGAVMIGASAIPTATQTGLVDQQVIDALNLFRSDLRQATTIQRISGAQGELLTLDIKDTGTPGTITRVRYQYESSTKTFNRLIIGRTDETLFENITGFTLQFTAEDNIATVLFALIVINGTIQPVYELNVVLPYKPELN